MSNNNVAIVSLMAKFDEKSIDQAAQKLGKTTEQALSNVGQDKFGQEIVNQFNEAIDIVKKKLKGVNLSSYTGSILDSLISDKDIAEKTKDLQKFISNIFNLSKSLSGLGSNALNSMTTKQLDAIIAKQEKIAKKNEEIATKTKELESTAKNIAGQKRSVSTIKKSYGELDDDKSYKSLQKVLTTETEFDDVQQKSIKHLSEMLTLYSEMEKVEPVKGTTEAIKHSANLLTVAKEIKKTTNEIDLFTGGKASKFVSENFDSIKKINQYGTLTAQQDYVKNGLKNFNAQKVKLEKDLTEYIGQSVQKNVQKIASNAEQVIDKTAQKVDKLQEKVDNLKGTSSSDKPIIDNIVDESQFKTLEELEDRLYSIYDKDSEGDASTKELKEFISLYQQYEKLISNATDGTKLDPELKEEYDFIIKKNDAMQKYADSIKEVKTNKDELLNVDSSSQTSAQLKEQETHIQNIEKAENDLADTQKTVSNTSITVDAEKAIESIKQVKENLDSIPNEKNIKISVNNIDYSSVPLLSNEEGKTVNMFRGVKNAWSGLVNDKGIGFFTDKLELAVDYADELAKDGKVIQANLSLHNPLEVEGNGARWDQIDFEGVKQKTDDIIEKAKQLGYDGVIFKNIRDGFTDAESDLSNVVAVFDAMSVKNEQVIGTVKAGTGELTKIESTTNSIADTVVDSQNKIQSELKETQAQAEETAQAIKEVSSAPQESNISSDISSDISSQVKISDNITDQIVSNEKKKQEAYKATAETVMYHAGTLSKLNKAETNGRFYGSNRGTGYFGTGHYFVDSNSKHYLDESSTYSKLPYSSIDISQYDNLFKANNDTIAKSLHEFLKNLTRYTQGDTKFNTNELFSQFENVFGNTVMDIKEFESRINGLKDFMSKSNLSDRSDSVSTQFMKSLGYGGVDTRGTKFADTEYGTVIYDLKEESVLQANITDELQKQGQMLEKINYKKGQVFDSSEDSRLQDIINQQEKGKAIREEYNKIYDDTKLDSYSTELSEINKKLDENDEIIGNCRLGIENAEKEAQQFAKEMKELGIEMSNEEIQNSAIESKKSYQERIDELEKERPLLEARRQELEANLDAESKLSKAAMERATATVEDRMKDAFSDSSTDTKPETEGMEQVEKATEEAVQAKKEFATANEGVQSSIDGSENPLKLEAELMEQIAKSAREAADAKKEFVEANKQVEKSADDSNSELKDTPKKDKYAKRNKISEDDFLNDSSKYTSIANSRLISSGNTILGNTVNADLIDGLVKVTAKIKDADGVWKTFSARIDADGNMFNQRFKAITKGVNQLEDDLKKFGKDKVKSDLTDIQVAKYQELENAIKNYEKISKRIASNSAYDGDEKSASDLLDTINEIMGKTNGGITVLSNEQLNKAQNKLDNIDQTISDIKQKTNISEFKNLEKLQSSAINKLNPYTNDTKYTIDFINKVNNLQNQIANFNLSNQSDVDRLKAIDAEIKNISKESNLLKNKLVKQKSNLAEIVSQMKIFKSQNTNMSRSQKAELDQIINYAETMQRSGEEVASEVENIKVRFAGLKAEVNKTGKAGKNFFDQIGNRLSDMNSKFIAQFLSWQDWIMYIRQAAEMVTELNTQITELAKVSEDSVSQIYADFDSYANIAKEMGSTISDTIAATTAWSKNGYNIPDSKKLAEVSLLYKNVGDGINIDEANESLVSTLKGFKLEADQAEHIVDVLNEVSNNEAISSSGIGEALQRSAASFNAANTSLEKSVALVTATNSVLQDPEKVGNMWKTVSARIRGAKSELAEMGEDTDDMVESTSKLRDLVKGITGFDIMKDENTFKDIYDIIIGISERWDTLSDIDQASLLENLAGKNQSNALAAALSNVDLLKKSYEEATNAEGSAREEQEKYTKSIKYSIDKAKASLEELANDFLSSDFLKGLIDAGEKIISFLDKIIDKVGVLPTLFTSIITILSIKNKNFGKLA